MDIKFIGSPNYTAGRGGYRVTSIVLHWMAGTLASADRTFQDRARNTSAHFGIEDDIIHQYVRDEDTAYQAGNWVVNEESVGIEHSAEPGRSPSDKTYEKSAQVVATLAKKYGLAINSQTVLHHYQVVATQCSGPVDNGGVDEERISRRANELVGSVLAATSAPAPTLAQVAGVATVTVGTLNVRTSPITSAPLGGSLQLTLGQTFDFIAAVQGESVQGVSTWLKSTKGNYVWAGGLDYPTTPPINSTVGGTAEAVRVVNVRVAPSTSAALGGSRQLQPGQTFNFSALVHGELVSQNGVSTDLWYHSMVGNYVWSGNTKTI